ncbi:MAG: carbohydrate binding family 9 domain-containing protein [Burkholderiaceae bacterium]|nr:carbohydrate binding family 9 domain-containing protein [Burkholderiaceae bacterium]
MATLALLCAAAAALAQGTAAGRAEPADSAVQAQRLAPGERIVLSGRLDHPAWQRAPLFERFTGKAPVVGATPSHRTELRVLFDDEALYVGVRAHDPEPQRIRAPLVRHDGVNRTQDFVVVYLDAIGARQSAQFFRINAAGSLADGMHTASDDSEDFAPDFDWDGAAARDAQGWTAVLRIPFASLRFTREQGPARPWRFMLGRRIPREQFMLDTSVPIPQDAPSFIATLQPLLGVQLPERHQFFTLRPSLTLRRQNEAPAGAARRGSTDWEATLDLKWRPLPETVVDATLNPDFSQVALDVPQLAGNTRFALSFPEKRPFFFESSDLLRTPTEALYTRSFTEPRWGLRATWRGARLAGSAFAIDDRGGGFVLLPGAHGTGVAEQPASRAVAARLRLGSADGDLQWGGLAVARDYEQGRGHNRVAGPDAAWQIDEVWRLRAQWLGSDTTAHDDGHGGLAAGPSRSGRRALLRLAAQSDRREGHLEVDELSQGFRHDTGFVNQTGVRHWDGRVAQGWGGLGPFNEFWINLEGRISHGLADRALVSRSLSPGLWVTGAHNLEAWAYWHGGEAVRPEPGAALLRPRFWRLGAVFTPAPWAPLLEVEADIGRLADMQAQAVRPGASTTLKLAMRPLPRLELEPSLSAAWLEQGGRRSYRESAGQLLAVWHFDAQQTLRAILQRSSLDRRAEPGLAAERDRGSTGSLTWAWRRSAGTVLYVGASRSRQGLADRGGLSRGNEAFIKLQVDAHEVGLF